MADRTLNWWNNTKPALYDAYTHSLNRIIQNYRKDTYHVWGIMMGATALICLIIIAKKTHLKQRKAKRGKTVKKEVEARKMVKKKAKTGIFENFRRLPIKWKIIFLIILVILLLIVIVSVLIDLKVLSVEQLSIKYINMLAFKVFHGSNTNSRH